MVRATSGFSGIPRWSNGAGRAPGRSLSGPSARFAQSVARTGREQGNGQRRPSWVAVRGVGSLPDHGAGGQRYCWLRYQCCSACCRASYPARARRRAYRQHRSRARGREYRQSGWTRSARHRRRSPPAPGAKLYWNIERRTSSKQVRRLTRQATSASGCFLSDWLPQQSTSYTLLWPGL